MHLEKLHQYLSIKEQIPGWFSNGAARLFGWIDFIQKREGIKGNLFEIGVHYGKSTVLVAFMTDSLVEKLAVCDVFDLFEKNVSASGKGNKSKFLENLRRYVGSAEFLTVYEKSSAELKPEEIGTNNRFFHIDGGHSAEETLSDLTIAETSIIEEGMVVIDDYFNSVWPGVSEGVARFMFERPGRLVPFGVGFNKVFFCKPSQREWYLRQLISSGWEAYLGELGEDHKLMHFFGVETLVYLPHANNSRFQKFNSNLKATFRQAFQ
jgi:hypothetical protein